MSHEISRRQALAILGAAAAGIAAKPSRQNDSWIYRSTSEIARAILSRETSSEEVVRAHLARIEEVTPKLNAVVELASERALLEARNADAALARGDASGALHGVPMTIKDSFDTEGVVTTGGTQGRADFVPERDATVVARLRRAGAILLGKTNTPELTLSFETTNLVYGRTSNPYDLTRTPGGSSGGAAAIVVAGGAPFDIGSDYGGSIRLPAHYCGIAGIKPTAGRVPRTGHIYPFGGYLDAFQQIGPLARTVDDLSFLLPLIAGPDGIDPGVHPMPLGKPEDVVVGDLRVAFHTDNGIMAPTLATARTIEAAAKALGGVGARVVEARPKGVETSFDLAMQIYFADGGAAVRRLLSDAGTTEHSLGVMAESAPASAEELDALFVRLDGLRSHMLGIFEDHDVVLCPVNAGPAIPHGTVESADAVPAFSYTMTYNMTGWPGVVVRGGTSPEGLPIGVQILAAPTREDVALAVARHLETELTGFVPPSL